MSSHDEQSTNPYKSPNAPDRVDRDRGDERPKKVMLILGGIVLIAEFVYVGVPIWAGVFFSLLIAAVCYLVMKLSDGIVK